MVSGKTAYLQIVTTFVRLCFDSSISQFGCHVHEWATSIELSCRTTLVKYNDQVLTITETGELTKKAKGPIITINYKRVIEVWMDEEYKKFFYTRCQTLKIKVNCFSKGSHPQSTREWETSRPNSS